MRVDLEKVSAEDYRKLGPKIHGVVFNESRPEDFDRIDFAILCHTEKHGLTAYATIIEADAETAHMQHGGTFPDTPKILTVKSYLLMIEYLKKNYPVLTTKIFNTNIAMIKLALTAGFLINGVEYFEETKNFKGGVLLNFMMESDINLEAN